MFTLKRPQRSTIYGCFVCVFMSKSQKKSALVSGVFSDRHWSCSFWEFGWFWVTNSGTNSQTQKWNHQRPGLQMCTVFRLAHWNSSRTVGVHDVSRMAKIHEWFLGRKDLCILGFVECCPELFWGTVWLNWWYWHVVTMLCNSINSCLMLVCKMLKTPRVTQETKKHVFLHKVFSL